MPCVDKAWGTKTIKQLADTAGLEADYFLLMDDERKGYVYKINEFVNNHKSVYGKDYDFYVYTCQDVKTKKNWLLHAYKKLEETNKGVLAFHDRKWNGRLAAFGMVRSAYLKPFFEDCYKMHYADTELTVKATLDNQLCYTPKAVMYEVDKNGNRTTTPDRPVDKQDRATFNKRQKEIYKVKMFK